MAGYYFSPTKQKAMLLLAAGVTLGLSKSPKIHWRIIKNLPKAWREIDRTTLRRIIKEFKYDRLVDFQEDEAGMITVTLNEKGRQRALRFYADAMAIKEPARWDKKWRVIIFDIMEKRKAAREAFRFHLQRLGFHQLQRSVWVHPYECKQELEFLVELYQVRTSVHYLRVEELLHDEELRLCFGLEKYGA